MKTLLNVALRQGALFVSQETIRADRQSIAPTTATLLANLAKLGYGVSEDLLHALNYTSPAFHAQILSAMKEKLGMNKNWTPLVKAWDKPTGETRVDHIITYFVNLFKGRGTQLACGHTIPANTFPLERYNGCPFCGMPFELDKTIYTGQHSKLKILELWTEKDATKFLEDLLGSKTALDATQMDSLKMLLQELPVPADVKIGMKETVMAVIDAYISKGEAAKAQAYFASPTDIMRYLWYKHTGFLQIIAPKTIVKRTSKNNRHIALGHGTSGQAKFNSIAALKLKYSRKDCAMVATWLNGLTMDTEKICETMHPKRGMWVRFIRALRLAEYAQKPGFEKLKDIMDKFYHSDYTVWAGRVNYFRLRYADQTLDLLKQRPGLFARSLFANMLWFGAEPVIAAFSEVIDQVPARLVFTLNMYADTYFDRSNMRSVKPLGSVNKTIGGNQLLALYGPAQLEEMIQAVQNLTLLAVKKRFEKIATENKTIYIEPVLYKIPLAIGDRNETIQDLSAVLMGTRFAVEGNAVRLFMQWGNGLPAQHMDMDLSCRVAFDHSVEYCSYSNLVATGCKHSGDIQSIPNQVGTAEYIELNLVALKKAGAKYVTFTCNAYSNGAISPNMVVGWMNSAYPMKISETSGVAYDPSCVQHQVRVVNSLAKGMVFGVLDVEASEIIWLEMPFGGQLVRDMGVKNVETLLQKLQSKITIGKLLEVKAEAQNLQLVNTSEADEIYTRQWASNTAAVTQLLVD